MTVRGVGGKYSLSRLFFFPSLFSSSFGPWAKSYDLCRRMSLSSGAALPQLSSQALVLLVVHPELQKF